MDNEDNSSCLTELKQIYEKEKYSSLNNFKIQKSISKLMLSSNKLLLENDIKLRKKADFVSCVI